MELNRYWLGGLALASLAMFVLTLFAIPAIVIRLPANYFCYERRQLNSPQKGYLIWYLLALGMKNVVGVVFIVMGIAMLVLPGQGIMSILVGMSLLNFPGKFRLEKFIATRKPVTKALNWIRKQAGKPPLEFVEHDTN